MTPVTSPTSASTPSSLSSEAPPDVPVATDPEAAIAMLEVTEGSQAEQADRSARESAEVQEEQENAAEVTAMHEKASLMRTQAWMDFGVSVMSTCVQASDASAGGSSDAASTSGSQNVAMMKAFQSLCDGLVTAKEADADADAKADQAGATAAGFAVTSDNQALGDASDLVKAALNAFQQYVTTQAQTHAAALHRA
jgi:hypothetical protein